MGDSRIKMTNNEKVTYEERWKTAITTPQTKLNKEDLDATDLVIKRIKNEYAKEYYKNNKEKIAARRLKIYNDNKEKINAIAREKKTNLCLRKLK